MTYYSLFFNSSVQNSSNSTGTEVSKTIDTLIQRVEHDEQQNEEEKEEEPTSMLQSPKAIILKPPTTLFTDLSNTTSNLQTTQQRNNRNTISNKPLVTIDLDDQMDILVTRGSSTNSPLSSPKEVDITIKRWERDTHNKVFNIRDNTTGTTTRDDEIDGIDKVILDDEHDTLDDIAEKNTLKIALDKENAKVSDMDTKVTDKDTSKVTPDEGEGSESPIQRRNRLSRLKNAFYISTLCSLKEEPLVDEFTEVDVQILDEQDNTIVVDSFISDVHSLNNKLGVPAHRNMRPLSETNLGQSGKEIVNNATHLLSSSSLQQKEYGTITGTNISPLTSTSHSVSSVIGLSPLSVQDNNDVSLKKSYSCDRDILTDCDYLPVKELIGDDSNHHNHQKEPKSDSLHHHQKLSETAVEIINDSNDTRQSPVDSITQKVSDVTTVSSGIETRQESEEPPSSDSVTQKISTVSSVMDNQVDEPQLVSSNNLKQQQKNVDLVTQKVSDIQPLPTQKDSRGIHDSNSNKSSSSNSSFFKCEECSLYYKSKESFHFHMQSTHGETTILMNGNHSDCQTTNQKQQQRKHKSYSCKRCKALFTSSKHLLRHVTFVHGTASGGGDGLIGVNGTKCTICGNAFLKRFYLKSHIRICHSNLSSSMLYNKKDKKPKTIF